MARRARIVVPGCAHHVTQRGNRRADVFRDEEDRVQYLRLLREKSIIHHVLIWVYTLMTNHIHTIVVPESEKALAETFRDTHSVYGHWFNRKYGLSGHLWQGRFYSCVVSEPHLWAATRYVERNPVRAGMVKRAEDYQWSSAQAHVFGVVDPLLDPDLPLVGRVGDWSGWLAAKDLPSELEAIRKATRRDYIFSDEAFISQLEEKLGRRLRPKTRGRKRKNEGIESEKREPALFG